MSMKKNIRVNISISPSVLEDAKKIATDRFAGNVSAYIAALIDYDIKQRGGQKAELTNIADSVGVVVGTKNKVKTKLKK